MNLLKAVFCFLSIILIPWTSICPAELSLYKDNKPSKVPINNQKTFSKIQLVSSLKSLSENTKTIPVGIWIELDKDWYTYWKFPGNTGKALNIQWSTDKKIKIRPNSLKWPIPERISSDSFINFVYKNQVLLTTELSLKSPLSKNLSPVQISAQVEWFICQKLCIPMNQDVLLSVPITEIQKIDHHWAGIFEDWSQKTPLPAQIPSTVRPKNTHWLVEFSSNQTYQLKDFFPLSLNFFSLQTPQILSVKGSKHSLLVGKPSSSKDDKIHEALAVFEDEQGRQFGQWLVFPGTSNSKPLLWFLLLAFLGGILLNFMPCVLPIVFLKLSNSLEQSQKSSVDFIKSNIIYSAGVISSFIVLAMLIIGFKQTGQVTNWGFQMQYPSFLMGMTLLFLLISFNFIGWFSFSLPNIPFFYKGNSYFKHFLTGVLSTTAASPCTVPFMGAAMAYAFGGNTFTVLTVFIFLGLGLSSPYLLLSFFPVGIKFLPKPGKWNETLKHFMAFPMLGTCAWLIHLINQHTNELLPLLFSMLSLALAFWLMDSLYVKNKWIKRFLKFLIIVSLIFPFLHLQSQNSPKNDIDWESFSILKMQNLHSQGEDVFVQLTAEWCLTCKWNEQVTFKNEKVIEFFNTHKIQALKGDWTYKNTDISLLLDRYNRSGIPFYLYLPGQKQNKEADGILLPELITPSLLLKQITQEE